MKCLGVFISFPKVYDIGEIKSNFFNWNKAHFYVKLFPNGKKVRLSDQRSEVYSAKRKLEDKLEKYRTKEELKKKGAKR